MEFATRAAPQKIVRKARFMKSSRIRENDPTCGISLTLRSFFLIASPKHRVMVHFVRCMFKNSAPAIHRAEPCSNRLRTNLISGSKKGWCDSHHILGRSGVRPCWRPTKEDVMGQFRKTTIATRMLLLLAMSVATPAAAATYDGQCKKKKTHHYTQKNRRCYRQSSMM